jgi:hypothetical protein
MRSSKKKFWKTDGKVWPKTNIKDVWQAKMRVLEIAKQKCGKNGMT